MDETIEKSIATCMRDVFQTRHDDLVNEESCRVLVSHFGTFTQELVGSLSNSVEQLLISIGDHKTVIKRMFSILLEGLHNIRKHGGADEEGNQVGFLLIGSSEENYKVIMANIIDQEQREKVEPYLKRLNKLSEEELRELYREALTNEFITHKEGGGLGIIVTRIKAGAVGCAFDPLCKGRQLFSLEVTLPRERK